MIAGALYCYTPRCTVNNISKVLTEKRVNADTKADMLETKYGRKKRKGKKNRRRPTRIELFSSFRLSCIGANRIGIINPLQNPKERKMMKGTQN